MFLLVKLLHIATVVLFLGNIITGLFWHAWAARTRDPALLAHTMLGIIRSDRLFTMPGVLGVIVTGVAAAIMAGYPILRTGWIFWTLVLFAISGLLFAWKVAPLQRQLHAMAVEGVHSTAFDFLRYRKLALHWEAWGALALLTPLAGLILMVLKPTF